jgi:LacI family transcriptional regulator
MIKHAPTPRLTLADIASGCGVSRATVSLVLRNSPLVHPDTRARVENELKRRGYVYNRAAASLRAGKSSSVALVINDLSNPFFAEFASGVDEALGAASYVTLLGSTSESAERQLAVVGSLLEHNPAGIILSPAEGGDTQRLLQVIGNNIPVLVFNRDLPGTPWHLLAMDNVNGARQATEYLLGLGHRRIAFFGGHRETSSCRQRREGYQAALAAAGIAAEPRWIVDSAPTRLEAARQVGALFLADPAPTAALAYNDSVALGLMMGLAARGRRPGHDFAVVGFDDIPEAAVSVPPLTTMSTEPRALGRQAAAWILGHAGKPPQPAQHIIAPVRLVVRESAAPPAAP